MGRSQNGGVPEDVLESLRSNPVLASVSEEALVKIAEMVAAETRAQVGNALRDVELFHGLSNEDLEGIQRVAEPMVVEAGKRLFEEGDPGDRFFVIVRGAVELRKGGEGTGGERLAVLRAGQAFGEAALLSDSPRSAAAHAVEPSYLIDISREAFMETLGGDSLAVRLLRNVSRALSEASVRPIGAKDTRRESPKEALIEYNRMVRARLLPRGLPHVSGFDVSATTVVSEHGDGAAAWDWFLLSDGRLALALLRVDQPGLSAAHRLASARGLLRDFADDPVSGLDALLNRVNRGLRAGWLDGVSGSVSCGLLALSDEGVSWASAGEVGGTLIRANGTHEDLVPRSPSLGSDDGLEYEEIRVQVAAGDRLLVFSDGPSDAVIVGRKVLSGGEHEGAKRALGAIVDRLRDSDAEADGAPEITAALVLRSGAPEERDNAGHDAIARAAAAYEAGLEEEASSRAEG